MKKIAIKEALHNKIDTIKDKSFLRIVHAMLEEYLKETSAIVGSKSSGEPITQADLMAMVEETEADVKAGRVHSHQEVIKHFRDKR